MKKQPVCAGERKANGDRSHYEVTEISPDAKNRFISGPADFTVIKSRKVIAVSGNRCLEETSPGMGRVLIPSQNFEGPVHRIGDIAKHGYWEPLTPKEEVKRIAEKVLSETTFHSKEVQMNDRDKRMTVVMGELTALLKKRDAKQVELGKLDKQIEAKQVELSRALPKAQQAPKPVVKSQPPTT
jgi:hypothetical protein